MMPISIAGKSNNQAGFTLIELALVVLILGMMAGLSLPLISGFEPNRLNSTARRLSGTVKYLYNEAAMTGQEHRLIFNLDKESYYATKLNTTREVKKLQGVGAEKKLADGVQFVDIYQPRKGEQSSDDVTTTFLPQGWLDETIIHLKDANDRQLTMRLVPLTGLSEIYEGYREFR